MVRLQILLLVVSAVLATVYSIENDDLNTKPAPKSDVKLIYSVIQRRRHKVSHEEIKDEDVGRYFQRPPRTTTVPSIFSMKIENTYQHVYPNMRPSDKQIHLNRNQTNVDDTGVSSKPSIIKIPRERIAMRTKNLSRGIQFAKRYHPAVAQPITRFNDHQLQEHKVETESISTPTSTTTTSSTMSTTPQPVVLDAIEKEHIRKESAADSKNLAFFPSRTIEISQDILAEIQNSEELSVIQRRRNQVPHEEIKDEDVGRYFRRPHRTTTVPSIFSMKVKNTYQHVYPNVRPADEQIHLNRNITYVDDTGASSKPSIIKIPMERIAMRTKNLSRRIPFAKRYHPAVVQPITSFNDHRLQEHKVETESTPTTTSTTTTSTTTPTTPQPVVLETTEMEQIRKESVANSQNLDSFPSKTIEFSQDLMAEIQNSEELTELKLTTTTRKPDSTTIKTLEETEFVPTSFYVPNIISHTRRRRPHFAKRVHMQPIKDTLTIIDDVILSTSAPTVDPTTETEQEYKMISSSHESDIPSIVKKPKLGRRLLNKDSLNRGSQKNSLYELRKQQTDISPDGILSTSTQGILSTLNVKNSATPVPTNSPKPPPVPTLSSWYDGFGK